VVYNSGLEGFFAGPEVHIVDRYGLVDPLVARLPVRDLADWRIGHVVRELPVGYEATVGSGSNQLVDPGIRAFYEDLSTIIHEPLLSKGRAKAIFAVNTGRSSPPKD
jgi:arabinofuranosyltransferase